MSAHIGGTAMVVRTSLAVAMCVSVATVTALAQSDGRARVARGTRTVPYHSREVIALRAKLRYTTLIVLPEGEDVVEATGGDKEVWFVNARGPLVSGKPAKAGRETNLNL